MKAIRLEMFDFTYCILHIEHMKFNFFENYEKALFPEICIRSFTFRMHEHSKMYVIKITIICFILTNFGGRTDCTKQPLDNANGCSTS